MAASVSVAVDFSYKSMMGSFLLSNMTPQLPGLNRQGWRYLEQYIRKWTNELGELYLVFRHGIPIQQP
jgi:endonuclease G